MFDILVNAVLLRIFVPLSRLSAMTTVIQCISPSFSGTQLKQQIRRPVNNRATDATASPRHRSIVFPPLLRLSIIHSWLHWCNSFSLAITTDYFKCTRWCDARKPQNEFQILIWHLIVQAYKHVIASLNIQIHCLHLPRRWPPPRS